MSPHGILTNIETHILKMIQEDGIALTYLPPIIDKNKSSFLNLTGLFYSALKSSTLVFNLNLNSKAHKS